MGNDLISQVRELMGGKAALDSMTGHVSPYGIIAIVFFSIIGFGYFWYGKRSVNYVFLFCGIALMAYPYFITRTVYVVVVGLVVSALPFIIKT